MTRGKASATTSRGAHKRRHATVSESSISSSDDDQELVVDARRRRVKRHKPSAILSQFTSLDALLHDDLTEKRKRETRERKLQKLREESEKSSGAGGSSPMGQIMTNMAINMSTLSGDSDLFSTSEVTVTEEKFGYVFTPMKEVVRCLQACEHVNERDGLNGG